MNNREREGNISADEIIFTHPPEVRGVSKQLVADLINITDSWGIVDVEQGRVIFRSGDLGEDLSFEVTRSVHTNHYSDLIITSEDFDG